MEGTSEAIENDAKEQKGGLLAISFGTLAASLLGNLLPGKVITSADETIEMVRTLNAISAFNKFGNTNMSSKST